MVKQGGWGGQVKWVKHGGWVGDLKQGLKLGKQGGWGQLFGFKAMHDKGAEVEIEVVQIGQFRLYAKHAIKWCDQAIRLMVIEQIVFSQQSTVLENKRLRLKSR